MARTTNNPNILKGEEIKALPITTLAELVIVLDAFRKEGSDEKETSDRETEKYGAGHAQEVLTYHLLRQIEKVTELK